MAIASKEWTKDLLKKALILSDEQWYSQFTSFSPIDRWLRFDPDNKRGLVIKKGTIIPYSDGIHVFNEDKHIDFSSEELQAGKDYFVFLKDNEDIACSLEPTMDNAVRIGRFHTLCVDAGTITMIAPASPSSGLKVGDKYLVKPYLQDEDPDFYEFYNKDITAITTQSAYDVVTCQHPLSGFVAGDILPESVFCLDFQPDTLFEDGMVYDKNIDKCVDIYLQSGTGFNTRSVFGAVHTVSRTAYNHREDMRMVKKFLLHDDEYTSAALGSNEKTNIIGSKDQTTVGGHVDTANRRMISAIGCEEMCGYLWTWLQDFTTYTTNGYVTTDTHASFGQEYGNPYVFLAGGGYVSGASNGSRCRSSVEVRSCVDVRFGGRGSSRIRR